MLTFKGGSSLFYSVFGWVCAKKGIIGTRGTKSFSRDGHIDESGVVGNVIKSMQSLLPKEGFLVSLMMGEDLSLEEMGVVASFLLPYGFVLLGRDRAVVSF